MSLPSTLKSPSNHPHDGVTLIPSHAYRMREGEKVKGMKA